MDKVLFRMRINPKQVTHIPETKLDGSRSIVVILEKTKACI